MLRRVLHFSLLPLVLASALLSGCSEEIPPPGIAMPEPALVTEQSVLCVPGVRFEEHPAGDLWRMQALGRFYCRVGVGVAEPLILRFEPDEATATYSFAFTWDGEPLLPEPARLPAIGYQVEVPAEKLTPGHHRFQMERRFLPGDGSFDNPHDNNFHRLGYRVGGREESFELAELERLRYVSDFLERGLTGLELEKWGGTLFDGKAPATVRIDAVQEGRAVLAIENNSAAEARFTVRRGEGSWSETLPPRGRGSLQVSVAEGANELELSVSGAPDGWFLWGRPVVRSTGFRSSATPVVLITLDTTRRDALSVYDAETAVTPEIARFAEGATVFERAYSTAPWTLPSHASMMTGLYPSRHEAGVSEPTLAVPQVTMAQLLTERGYLTAGFPGSFVCATRYGVSHGFSVYRNPEGHEVRGDVMTDNLLRFLAEHGDQPLFLFANYFDPHVPYLAPEPFAQRLNVPELRQGLAGQERWSRFASGDLEPWMDIVGGDLPATPEALAWLEAAYRAEVAFMDAQIGRLLQALREADLYDRALIVMVADHGEMLGERGHFSHSARLDPELVEVPLLVKWPGQTEASRVEELVSVVDLFPTLLAAAGVEAPASDGRRLTPQGPELAEPRPHVLLEEHESLSHPLPPGQKVASHLYGVQTLRTQHSVWPGGEQCFERRRGPWRSTECPAGGGNLFASLQVLLATGTTGEAGAALSEEDVTALRALGYI